MADRENDIQNDGALLVQRYQLGLMTPDEEVSFEHAVAKSPELQAQLREAQEGISAMYERLSQSAPAPRKSLKNKIIGAVTGSIPDSTEYESSEYVLRQADSEWVKTSIDGIHFRMLYKDDDGRTMLLARFDPGAVFPPHHRLSTEECYVISGDFWADGEKLGPGDFIAGKKGFEPLPIYSEGGCELLLKLLIPNEILPG